MTKLLDSATKLPARNIYLSTSLMKKFNTVFLMQKGLFTEITIIWVVPLVPKTAF